MVSEASLGGHRLITFAASSSRGPAGLCEFTGGNLGVFEGGRLVGLFWSHAKGDSPFGRLQIDCEGVVDLHSSTFPVVPTAEIVRLQGDLVLRARPATLAGCGGAVEVPQLWLAPIGTLRDSLIALGWTPMSPSAQDPVSAEMQAQGFPETESCSGTGANYCSYDYVRPEARLRVISLGELGPGYQPSVADYELNCR